MVKLGFIVEGASEKRILDSIAFREFLKKENIDFVSEIVDAKGSGRISPHNREKHVSRLTEKGATHIIILTDKENESCFTSVKNRIQPRKNETVLISAKAIEAWYLADSETISTILRKPFKFLSPENTSGKPYDAIKNEFLKNGYHLDTKLILADRMIRNGFTVEKAAAHDNCPSAKYFLKKLKELSKN